VANRQVFVRRSLYTSARRRERNDGGVILVFWALLLPLLAALLVGVIELGNLLQSGDNAQNAADAAALSAADQLQSHTGLMVVHSIPALGAKCQPNSAGIITCNNYTWLNDIGYSIYEGGQWESIGTDTGDQISAISALTAAARTWSCSPRRHSHYCTFINIGPPGPAYGVDASLSDDATISLAVTATNAAASIAANYGFTGFSGCTPPTGFLLAEGPTAINCIAYDSAGTMWVSVSNSVLFPGSDLATSQKSSWAALDAQGTALLCPGPPPSEQCH
jgi:hypothetical protein